jgi:hypothetical protein
LFPAICTYNKLIDVNFGQQPFAYTPPTGFNRLNTFNLPTPTIGATASTQAGKYFNPVLYTGDNSSSKSITGVGFQPDFVWIKARSIAYSNILYDVVRGTGNTKNLSSDSISAEPAFSSNANLSSFDSDGFTVGSTASTNILNGNTSTYVAWNWKANGAGSSNTSGTITSTVSANTSAGFSIVTFTTVTSGTSSVGHGLGVTPSFVIFKARGITSNWICQHTSTGTQYLLLNGTGAATTDSTVWNSAPTSSVVNMGTGFAGFSGATAVMYCFAPVAGYSAFGSYTGNGSSDGRFVFTGFRPRFIMVKRTDSAGNNWTILDSARSESNDVDDYLYLNLSNAEIANTNADVDFLSNGFKIRNTTSDQNTSGATYIYMAFAENPFKYANAR